jgi:tetraacyldisaccharide 4'-kinase
MGVALRTAAYRRGWLATRRLNKPVVSVGNLSVGGTGKTPFVAYLADVLMRRGLKPAILTRGYGRRKGAKLVTIAPGANREPDPREVGDEPALLARKLPDVPIVVCADRYHGGLLAEEKFGIDVHILDDGFQHFALARDVDIVLLDATQELSDRGLLPAGKLREPLSALARAHSIVLTRSELADSSSAGASVQSINPKAGIFHCDTALRGLLNISSGESKPIEQARTLPAYAFCGIGNPSAFFADLRKWEFSVVGEEAFPDHYVYRIEDLARLEKRALSSGATVLLTTEKDMLKLQSLGAPDIPILACKIQVEIRERNTFEGVLFERLSTVKVSA